MHRRGGAQVFEHVGVVVVRLERKLLAVVDPQNLRPGLGCRGADQVHTRDPVRVIPLFCDQLEGPNDDRATVQRFAGRAIGHVHHMLQIAPGGFLSRVDQLLAQCLLNHLQPQMLGKLLLAQCNAIVTGRKSGLEQGLVLSADIQLPG